LLRAYIDSANDGIFVVCDEMKFHVANRLLAEWLGATETSLTAHNQRLPITRFLADDESRNLFRDKFQDVLQGRPARFECQLRHKDGTGRWVEISLSRVNLEAGDLFIGVARDITERRALLAEVHHHARHDDLTGLVNRREFERQLNLLFQSAKAENFRHVLLYLDLDQFKVVNDSCGHMAGDELLRQLAAHTQKEVRKNDTFARLGGDEFGVLLENCGMDQALEIAEKLRQNIAAYRFKWNGRTFDISVSIGVCEITRASENPSTVLAHADAACYAAKDKGRNRVQLYDGGK
jgi:diguanylate cyclase (GGDEF)-like protein/PAS domain S-box-containing protein